MGPLYSKIARIFFATVAAAILAGCETVPSTSAYYLSYTEKVFPPKPKDAPIPILSKAPDRPYKVIGRLAFNTGRGWRFLRDSMLYNARANGADLVLLMRDGVTEGRIDSVRDEHLPEAMGRAPRVYRHGGEVYVYRRAGLPCLVCGTPVRTQVLEGRNLYWCPRCQRRR